jgi:pyroglutamyl-peptidase
MRLLLTGFSSFAGEKINPSERLLPHFASDVRVQTLLLPVSYQRSWQRLQAELRKKNFDFLLMMGQAGGREKISLERVALNYADAEVADEDGQVLLEKTIDLQGPQAYISALPLRSWLKVLRGEGIASEISTSAGTYVCNHLYYQAQHFGVKNSLFVHLPYLPEQLSGKPAGTPAMQLETMKQALSLLLGTIL